MKKLSFVKIFIFLFLFVLTLGKSNTILAYENSNFFSGNLGIGTTESSSSADLTPPTVDIFSPLIGSIVTGVTGILANAWDNVAVDRVEFFVDGQYLGVGSSSPYSTLWDTTTEASDSGHMLSAKAVDSSGNEASSSAIWVWVDNTPPFVNLTNPLSGSLVSGLVILQASPWDGIGISRVDFYVDGALVGSRLSYPYSVSWNSSSYPALSTHEIYAKTYDLVGHEAISNTVNVTVADTTSPVTSITNPSSGTAVSGVVNISSDASDNVGVSKVEFYVDGELKASDFAAPYLFAWDTIGYVNNSSHTIYTKAYDSAGNTGTSGVVSVTVQDITPPSVAITNPTNGSTVAKNSTVSILATTSDISGIQKVEFYVDGSLKCSPTTSPYSCSWKVPSRKNVTYVLQAKAFDSAGNIATNIVSVTSK